MCVSLSSSLEGVEKEDGDEEAGDREAEPHFGGDVERTVVAGGGAGRAHEQSKAGEVVALADGHSACADLSIPLTSVGQPAVTTGGGDGSYFTPYSL